MRISGHGITIDLPSGWEGRIYRRPEAYPVLHAANFPLPAADGDFGASAVAEMGSDGVFVALAEFDPAVGGQGLFLPSDMPLPLRKSEVSPRAMQRVVPGLAGIQRFFTQQGRPFCLYVVVGSAPSRGSLVRSATRVLKSVAIEPRSA